VSSQSDPRDVHFEPLHPATRRTLIVGFIVGPILWLVALSVAAFVFTSTEAVPIGIAVAVVSCLIAMIILNLLLSSRRRQERRYVGR